MHMQQSCDETRHCDNQFKDNMWQLRLLKDIEHGFEQYSCLTWFLLSLQINRWVLNNATPTSNLAWNNDRENKT